METLIRYEPAPGAAGAECTQRCAALQDACRGDCRAAWQACTSSVEAGLEARYDQALQAWQAAVTRYRGELQRRDWDLWVGWGHGYGGVWNTPWSYPVWPGYYPLPPAPGEPPSRDAVRADLDRAQCKDDCACQFSYDDCYLACGGHLVPESRYVANCPAAAQP